jgi:hypothetical protein
LLTRSGAPAPVRPSLGDARRSCAAGSRSAFSAAMPAAISCSLVPSGPAPSP